MRKSLLLVLLSIVFAATANAQGYSTELISHSTLAMVSGDLDNDGDIDVVTGGLRNLVWYVNDGTGTFEKNTLSLDAQEAQCVLLEDLD